MIEIGDVVRYTPGFKGHFTATVVDYNGLRYVIEFESGFQMSVREDDLERN
jgi:hypothetical protein